MRNLLILLLMIISTFSYATGGQESGYDEDSSLEMRNDEVDYLSIAAIMVRDGRYDKAKKAMEMVDPKAQETDKIRYYTIRGLLNLSLLLYEESIRDFLTAIEQGQKNQIIYVYLTQSYYALKKYEDTIVTIERIQDITLYPELLGIKAQSYWESGNVKDAYVTVEQSIILFPAMHQFHIQKIGFLLELNLTREAINMSKLYLSQFGNKSNAYLTIGEALRRGGELEPALKILEMAKIKYPEDQKIRLALAQVYLFQNKVLIAAKLVEEAALYDPRFYKEAAELYSRAGDLFRALYINSLLTNQEEKAEQRFRLLLQQEKYEEASALEPRLINLGLVKDDRTFYALAYVFFRIQEYGKAISYLNKITGSEIFQEATQLRKAIEVVKAQSITYF
ncbi:MAG: hypothetical protein JXJ04_24655 [Spirochaetales bacterium]|nr:hypothetical protein [Spirochaetales bacterium]